MINPETSVLLIRDAHDPKKHARAPRAAGGTV